MGKKDKIITEPMQMEFEKVPFEFTINNNGRCVKCDARNICGKRFKCPCTMDEQLMLVKII